MMYLDIQPQIAASASWNTPNNILSQDGNSTNITVNFTDTGQAQGLPVYCYNFSNMLPENVIITGLQVSVIAYDSYPTSDSAGYLKVGFGIDSSYATVSNQVTNGSYLNSGGATYVYGSSGSLNEWGYDLTATQINDLSITVSPVLGNTGSFPVNTFYIDSLSIRIWYTEPGYLVGNRSTYSFGNQVLDNLKPIANGLGADYQVKSEQLNTLGDCLYNLEDAIIQRIELPLLNVTGNPNHPQQFFYTITISGTISSPTNVLTYERSNYSSPYQYPIVTNLNNVDFGSTLRTKEPYTFSYMRCRHVSAIGWVETASGNVALYVSPANFVIQPTTLTPNHVPQTIYWLSVTALNSDIVATSTNTNVPNQIPNNTSEGYEGVQIGFGSIPVGTVYIKIFAAGIPGQ